MKLFEQFLKRQILIRISIQCYFSDALNHIVERGSVGKIRPQRQCVEEQSDETFQFGVVAARDGCTYENIFLAGVFKEQHLEGCEESHKERCIVSAAQSLERFREVGCELHALPSTAKCLDWRSRVICGQIYEGVCVFELLPPVREFGFQHITFEPLTLPGDKVSVLDR